MFNDWLLIQLQKMNWSQADLARASGLTRAAISRYMSDSTRIPEEAALRKLAKAFKIPAEDVFRTAGVLPPASDDPWADTMRYKISHLTGARREMAERLLNTLLDEQDRESRSQAHNAPLKP